MLCSLLPPSHARHQKHQKIACWMPLAETGECEGQVLAEENWNESHSIYRTLRQGLVLHTLPFQWEVFNKRFFGVSDGGHGLGAKVSTTSLFQRMKCVGRKTILHYSKKCPSIIDERFCLEGVGSTSCPVSLTGSWRRNGDLRVVQATCKGFLDLFTQIWVFQD